MMTRTLMTRALKALAIAGTIAGATAAAALPYPYAAPHTPADYPLNGATAAAHGNGFDRLVYRHNDQMQTGGREVSFVVLLQAGADYRLDARCGVACVNFNLSIRDAAGRELAAGDGDVPGFDFRATYSGAYVVTLDLASCRTSRCNVGAVVLGRGTPAPDA
jgi:hypothetical protein